MISLEDLLLVQSFHMKDLASIGRTKVRQSGLAPCRLISSLFSDINGPKRFPGYFSAPVQERRRFAARQFRRRQRKSGPVTASVGIKGLNASPARVQSAETLSRTSIAIRVVALHLAA